MLNRLLNSSYGVELFIDLTIMPPVPFSFVAGSPSVLSNEDVTVTFEGGNVIDITMNMVSY
jgi:hypothetical protein